MSEKVLWHVTMSLDGFIAGKSGEMDWLFEHAGRDLVIFGADVARQCLEHGLIDEIVIHVAPVLLGGGVRLYGAAGAPRVDLHSADVQRAGQITNLRFDVVKG